MGAMASQITSLTIVFSTVYLDTDQRKTPKLRVTGLCTGNSTETGDFPAQWKIFPFDDVIMKFKCWKSIHYKWNTNVVSSNYFIRIQYKLTVHIHMTFSAVC